MSGQKIYGTCRWQIDQEETDRICEDILLYADQSCAISTKERL